MLERLKHLNNTHLYVCMHTDGIMHTGLDIIILFPLYKPSVRWFKTVSIVERCSLVLCANVRRRQTIVSC